MLHRRALLRAALASLTGVAGGRAASAELAADLATLEQRHGGRLGVAVLDANGTLLFAHREGELFPLCSTHKVIVAALVLSRADRHEDDLARRIDFAAKDLVDYSPATSLHAGKDGMSLGELCRAAVELSDNTAANLLIETVGGPPAVTRFIRSCGDPVTRLDRTEPSLNVWRAGEDHDTTSPHAMAGLLRQFFGPTFLSSEARQHLATWMVDCRTGTKRLRAGLPATWRAGDKMGTWRGTIANDVAVVWPPKRAPMFIAAYCDSPPLPAADRDAILADIGRLVASASHA